MKGPGGSAVPTRAGPRAGAHRRSATGRIGALRTPRPAGHLGTVPSVKVTPDETGGDPLRPDGSPEDRPSRLDGMRDRAAPHRARLQGSELAKTAGLAGAMVVSNAMALVATLAFGRLLQVAEYGSLASLLSAFLILSVPGSALQAAVAREGALGHLGTGRDLSATLTRWTRTLSVATIIVLILSVLGRQQLANAIGVDQVWAAAATPTAAMLWMLLSIERGVLQSQQMYRTVGTSMIAEQVGRLFFGVILAAAGLGATGAFLGTPLTMLAVTIVVGIRLHRALGPERTDAPPHRLRDLIRNGWVPIVGLMMIAILQNIDVIVAKHQLSPNAAGAYAAAAVASKVVIWIAVGIGLYLLPEATRRHAEGLDARPVFVRALGVISAVAVPALIIFAVAPDLVIKLGFGAKYLAGADVLLILGVAMSMLAITYLGVQYLLALHRSLFLAALSAIAIAEPFLLVLVSGDGSLTDFAWTVLGVQTVAMVYILAASLLAGRAEPLTSDEPFIPEADAPPAQAAVR